MVYHLLREQIIPASLTAVWDYFCNPKNLNELTPPDMNFEIRRGGNEKMYEGQIIEYRVEFIRGVRSLWLTEIAHVQEGQYFVDEQRVGPYRFWYHEHIFAELASGTEMLDKVTYVVPFGLLGEVLHRFWIWKRLEYIFDYRTQRIKELFEEAK